MNDNELEELLKKSSPKELNIEYDKRKIRETCEIESIRRHNIFTRFSLTLSSFALICVAILSIFLLTNNKVEKNLNSLINTNDKIQILRSSGYDVSGVEGPGSVGHIATYGVTVLIHFDFSKHPMYDEWVKECEPLALAEMEKQLDEDGELRYSDDYYMTKQLLIKWFDETNSLFPNITWHSFFPFHGGDCFIEYKVFPSEGETIEEAIIKNNQFFEEFLNSDDYNNILELSNNDYIVEVIIGQDDVHIEKND